MATKQAPKNTGNRKFSTSSGKRQPQVQAKVVSMRDKKNLSWAVIAEALDIAPRTARRIYDEKKGAGAHHGLLPGKGGRKVAA